MDLDALGLNSTFESTDLDQKHQPKVDVIETSDIEGPDDFTMNMTYWMTADLTRGHQVRSRKEADTKVSEVRGDANFAASQAQDALSTRDRATMGKAVHTAESEANADLEPTSTTPRVDTTAKGFPSSKAPSEASMEHDEKVRSYLSALPDTDLDGHVLTSTPLRIPKHNLLPIPSSPARARSLQPTVEDHDTPRKPTQETVIHHPPQRIARSEQEMLRQQIEELQARMQEDAHTSKTRITELETLLSYTRSDLDTARSEVYKQRGQMDDLQKTVDRQQSELEARAINTVAQDGQDSAKSQGPSDSIRLQYFAEIQSQKEDFKRQLQALEEAKRNVDQEMTARGELLAHVQAELKQLRGSNEQGLDRRDAPPTANQSIQQGRADQALDWEKKLAAVQERADSFQADLEKASAELKDARQEAIGNRALQRSTDEMIQSQSARIAQFQSQVSSLESEAASSREELIKKDKQIQQKEDLESQLRATQTELEDLRKTQEQNQHWRSEYTQLESQYQNLRSQLRSTRTDSEEIDELATKPFEERQQIEQRLQAAQGRIDSLEATIASLRQQLGEAHRETSKARTDAEQFKDLLEDANDRLQDARAEADRRVLDVEMKLSKLKDLKTTSESKLKERLVELQTEHDELKEDHEMRMESVRDNAEDAIRKAGSLLEKERAEKRKAVKEAKKMSLELEHLRAKTTHIVEDDDQSGDEDSTPKNELESLRLLVQKQASTLKRVEAERSILRKEAARLQDMQGIPQNQHVLDLQSQLDAVRRENQKLRDDAAIREQDFQAVNKAMDERLARMLSKALKERTKTAVNKRDGQWVEKMQNERELMGKVLMREWGRQEVGVAEEGEKQSYRYKYVQNN